MGSDSQEVRAVTAGRGTLYAVVYDLIESKPRIYSFRSFPQRLSKFVFLLEPGDHNYKVAVFRDRDKGVHYHLLFSYLPDSSSDGAVELSSQLLSEAQEEAESIRGFEVGHVEVLSRDDVFEYVEARLPSHSTTDANPADGGEKF